MLMVSEGFNLFQVALVQSVPGVSRGIHGCPKPVIINREYQMSASHEVELTYVETPLCFRSFLSHDMATSVCTRMPFWTFASLPESVMWPAFVRLISSLLLP